MSEKFLLIDGSSLLHRAFFALPPLTNKAGVNTGAVYGLCNMLLKLLQEIQPKYMLVAFDKSRKSFRTEKFAEYKGQRKATPPELKEQFPLSIELLQTMGIPTLELDNYEADDIIGTLSAAAPEAVEVKIVTGDRDEFQLIKGNVEVLFTKKGISNIAVYDEKAFGEEYQGLVPKQIIDLKGLMGDTSDNIPGVPGVGPKTAMKLLTAYQSVENVLDHADEVKGKSLQEKLKTYKEQALLSKDLATICLSVPIDKAPSAYPLTGLTSDSHHMMQELQFKNLWDRFVPVLGLAAGTEDPGSNDPMALFGAPTAAETWVTVEITDNAQAEKLLEDIRKKKSQVALAYKTSGLLPQLNLDAVDLAFENKHYHFQPELAGKTMLLELLADASVSKAIADPKELYKYMLGQGSMLRGVTDDPALAGYLYEPGATSYSLTNLGEEFLPAASGEGAQDTASLVPVLREKLKDRELTNLYENIELPLTENLAEMEFNGITIDQAMLDEVTDEMKKKVSALEQQAWDQAGEEFNLNSPKQLGVLLFEKLGLPIIKKTKTGYSTDVSVLEALQGEHPIIETLIAYRQLSKLLSTYLLGLHPLINPNTGRIHTHFNQMATVTGRLSSTEPNLQNIPTRTDVGRRMREMFVPGEGYDLLMSCDYSQVELRVMASIANDELLLDSFRHGQDVHARTASEIFGVPLNQVTHYMRSKAKTVNFGIIYGISDFGLARQLGVSRSEAAQYIESYFARYTGVKAYMEREKQKARDLGYVETLFGRRRYLPDIKARNFNRRSFAERTAINTPIQGTAADIIKIAMLKVAQKLKEAGVKSRVLLQVHDELVLEVPKEEKDQVAKIVKTTMEQAVPLEVPLVADVATGENWARAK
ncbi:DNA polymerase I [uncultured Acidaminococcus sp.]|uniref:DNA polymerase I n=1 Tax=uncultured Acidaminococcus sp. TaxID=352152 RepID=UPI00259A47A1|nr:DNA polymerase I [uncultured Acidaminococcus sp.]